MDSNVKIMNSVNNGQIVLCHHDIVLKNDLYYDSLYNFKEICLFCGREVKEHQINKNECIINLSKYSEGLLKGIFSKESIIDIFREMYLEVVDGEPQITETEKKEIFIEYIDKTNRQAIRNYRESKVKQKDLTITKVDY